MLNRLDYSYNGEESIVHRLNPVVKIFGLIVYVLICLLKFNYLLFIVSIVSVFILVLLSNIRITRYIKNVSKLFFVFIAMYIYMIHKNMPMIDINIILC